MSTDEDDLDRSWCTVAYWELRQRLGPLCTVRQPYVDIFTDLALGSGICLAQFHSSITSQKILRARQKIGAGLVLSREPDGVWIYNRSAYPIFVGGPGPSIDRLGSGFCLRVIGDPQLEPADPQGYPCLTNSWRSVQVSFGKGFGVDGYSRRSIDSCPCWIEVMLRVT